MKFNYDNPHIHAACVPYGSGGQFLTNCLSYSKYLVTPSTDAFLRHMIDADGADYQYKHDHMMNSFPKRNSEFWHDIFYHASRWYTPCPYAKHTLEVEDYTSGYFHVGLPNTEIAQAYMDHYWRTPAIEISNKNMGFVLPCHQTTELEAWKMILPKAKVYTVVNYEWWMNAVFAKKNKFSAAIEPWWKTEAIYEPQGFVFDLHNLIKSRSSFLEQFEAAYKYFDLDDFHVVYKMLAEYRKRYLAVNFTWTRDYKPP